MNKMSITALMVVQVEILVIRLLMSAESVAVTAAEQSEWAAVVVPVTWSPVTGHRDRPTSLQPDTFWFWKTLSTAGHLNHYDSMLTRKVEKITYRASAASRVVTDAFRDENKTGEACHCKARRSGKSDKGVKNRRCGNRCKKGCRGKGKNRNGRDEECRGKNHHGRGHNGNNRNGKNKPRTTNNNGAELIVDNKVFVNFNGDQLTSSVPSRTETTVEPLNAGQVIYNCWKKDILWFAFEVVSVLTAFAIVTSDCLTTFGCRRRV